MLSDKYLFQLSNKYSCMDDMALESHLIRIIWGIKSLQEGIEAIDSKESIVLKRKIKRFEKDLSTMLLKMSGDISSCA